MNLFRIGLASINSTVGAIDQNVDKLRSAAEKLAKDGVGIAAFPELVLPGYPCEDLVLWPGFVEAQLGALARFVTSTSALPLVSILGVLVPVRGQVYSCAAVVQGGRLVGLVPKEKLPLYGVFYEARTLSPGEAGLHHILDLSAHGLGPEVPFGDLLFQTSLGLLAVEICEDIWSPEGPLRRRAYQGAETVINLSASPFRIGMHDTRRELISTRAADSLTTIAYVNTIGANDGLVFDGGGFVAQCGRPLLDMPQFQQTTQAVTIDRSRTLRLRAENTTFRSDCAAFLRSLPPSARAHIVSLPSDLSTPASLVYPAPAHRSFFLPAPANSPPPSQREVFCEQLLSAMTLGLGDYFEKTGAFQQIGVALSGGRDSLLCLLIAHRYIAGLGPKETLSARLTARLATFYMPTRFSSPGTQAAAERTAQELGVPFTVLSIDEAFTREAAAAQAMLKPGETVTPLTLQNIQSRLRAERMWNWSNAAAGLFVQTGNMSEKAVGYTTIGGDLMGCLAPIANLPKTVVNYLLDYLLETQGLESIRQTLAIPASAELAPNQEDERDLMPYPVLDAHIALQVGNRMDPPEAAQVVSQMFPNASVETHRAWADKFATLFTRSIYKWVQAPLSLHLGNLDIERERALQLPVVSKPEWRARASRG